MSYPPSGGGRAAGWPSVSVDADPFGVEQLATHRVGLDEAATMYDVFQKKQDGCQKVVLKP